MKKLIMTMAVATAGLSASLAQVTTIQGNYSAGDGIGFSASDILDSSGTAAASGWVVRYGNFGGAFSDTDLQNLGAGGLTAAELATINGSFSSLFDWSIGQDNVGAADAGAGQFEVQFNAADGTAFSQERMYLLVYNVNSVANVGSADEFLLVRNDSDFGSGGVFPLVPQAIGPIASGLDLDSTLQTPLLGSLNGADFQMTSVVIPEPGAWAALAGVFGALALWRARRKRA